MLKMESFLEYKFELKLGIFKTFSTFCSQNRSEVVLRYYEEKYLHKFWTIIAKREHNKQKIQI